MACNLGHTSSAVPPTDCYSCHTAQWQNTATLGGTVPNHLAADASVVGIVPTACATCHITTNWLWATFDHNFWSVNHGNAAFAVMGGPCAAQAPPGEIAPAASPSVDALVLARKHVQDYFEKFSDLTCKETVTQIVLNNRGHAIYRETSAYDYQFEATSASGSLKFIETRESRNPAFRDPARTLLVTTGFASLLLVAHPMYEASYVFEPAGAETIAGVSYTMIRFVPVPGASSPASLRLRGKNYPLPMSGTLWIDPQSGAIVKLEAKVDSSLSDLGFAGMRSEVHYALHSFRDPAESVWIAESAVIDVDTPRQHWRNLHRFTDYKRFNVNVHEEMGKLP